MSILDWIENADALDFFVLFWTIIGVVVIIILAIIARIAYIALLDDE